MLLISTGERESERESVRERETSRGAGGDNGENRSPQSLTGHRSQKQLKYEMSPGNITNLSALGHQSNHTLANSCE